MHCCIEMPFSLLREMLISIHGFYSHTYQYILVYIFVVPQPKVRIKGQSSVPTELIVTWEIDDDKKFSMFQHYNLSLVEKATSTHILTISRESYDLEYKFVNLKAYTEYNITVKQCFLGGACKSSTINVTTAEKGNDGYLI